ncbi:glycerol-3-phosphate dehydrogenase [NAD(+)], cytoplasmic-like isoform X2 [Watersipora subatra]|uniref:glycerol-3-phosphate dehydrogenase [NAD(+)], cytoplasmic-like isoform X2 n=1 Tax=Watersipora subatra TaxID=2589382 RepID=UPI00355B3674
MLLKLISRASVSSRTETIYLVSSKDFHSKCTETKHHFYNLNKFASSRNSRLNRVTTSVFHYTTPHRYFARKNCHTNIITKFSTMADVQNKKKVCIVGSGNWGSAIAKIIGNNLHGGNDEFDSTVNMYVYEELFNGKKLSEIINTEHENKKYLPGIKLPDNVVAVTDLATAADGADILVFVVPHQFIRGLCKQLEGKVKNSAIAVSLIKGLDVKDGGGLLLISDIITECMSIPCHVLMGANLAGEVAGENYCEATIGSRDIQQGLMLKRLLQTKYFRLVVVEDAVTVEICGALKNIVAVGAGFADGLGYGDNTKAAVIRLGLMEMIKFVDTFYEGTKPATFLESCGVADLVTTCYGGRNRRVAEAMVKTGKSLETLEKEMLNGQKLQGPPTAAEVSVMLKAQNKEHVFPLFAAVQKICVGEMEPKEFIDALRNHPEHM